MMTLWIVLTAVVLGGFVTSRIALSIGRGYASGQVGRQGPTPEFQSMNDPYIQGLLDQLYTKKDRVDPALEENGHDCEE